MPKGPSGQTRLADAIGSAVVVAQLATGQITENLKVSSGKVRSGLADYKARAANMTPKQRSDNARRAAATRWG